MVTKLTPIEARGLYKTTTLNGQTYTYLLSEPKNTPTATIFLIHGFPDISFGWRNQIPFLNSLGLRVVVPDMMGYGGTAAPQSPEFYTFKRTADDMAALAKQLGLSRIILGGHDWGGAVVYRVALYYPDLISAVFSVCTPFMPPQPQYLPMHILPNFKYQIQLASPEVEEKIVGEKKIRQFLTGLYGGRTPAGKTGFDIGVGVLFDNIEHLGPSPLLSQEEMDFYVERFAITGLHGPTNWYRTGELNWANDLKLEYSEGFKFNMPFLFIAGARDEALPPAMSAGMDKHFRSLTRGEVNASHWALWEKPAEVNQYIKEFLVGAVERAHL